jgi:hypothetical protein
MRLKRRAKLAYLLCLGLALLLVSCSTGPAPPARGTPAFYWQAATETFGAGDYLKASDHLEQLTKPGGEYAARAVPWLLVVSGGMASGYLDMVETFWRGSRANRANQTPFRRQMGEYQMRADRRALEFAETFLSFQKMKEASIPLAFPYPKGSPNTPADLTKVGDGIVPSDAEVNALEKEMIERGVLLQACQAVGAPEDTAKTQEIFAKPDASVPRETFVFAMAKTLYDLGDLYTPSKLDQPQRIELFYNEALESLKSIPETKDSKELIAKIEKDLKKFKKR